ncbi:cancer/testis antigen 47B-like [Equus quagga]|uniref:cancer/testis antigen 47B-like n=1 Tax=Equus quagga TaxID=89248 RepID=UPI001EE2BAED|nr:cancer/testis antigen 47B-like [Equus quagga]
MSATGEGDLAAGGLDRPVGVPGACALAAGAGDGLVGDSGPQGAARVTAAAAAAGALGEAAGEPGAGGPEGGSAEEDSDIEPAEEGEEAAAAGRLAVDAAQFPRASLRLLFLEFAQSLLRRLFYKNHVLLRPWPPAPDGSAQRPAPRGPAPPEPAACALPPVQEPGAEAATQEPATQEPAEEAAAPEETTKYRCENSNEEAHDAADKDEKEKFNKKQEGPENALDPTDSTPRKSSWEE